MTMTLNKLPALGPGRSGFSVGSHKSYLLNFLYWTFFWRLVLHQEKLFCWSVSRLYAGTGYKWLLERSRTFQLPRKRHISVWFVIIPLLHMVICGLVGTSSAWRVPARWSSAQCKPSSAPFPCWARFCAAYRRNSWNNFLLLTYGWKTGVDMSYKLWKTYLLTSDCWSHQLQGKH